MKEGTFELGPTGDYPDGKIHATDEGGLVLAVGIVEDRIVIEFGKSTPWIGLGVHEALGLANMLVEKAGDIEPERLREEQVAIQDARDRDIDMIVHHIVESMVERCDEKADEAHGKALAAEDVVHMSTFAAIEKTWRNAVDTLHEVVEKEFGSAEEFLDARMELDPDTLSGLGSENSAAEAGEPCAVRAMGRKDVD